MFFSPNSHCIGSSSINTGIWIPHRCWGSDTLNRQVSDTKVMEVIVQNDNLTYQRDIGPNFPMPILVSYLLTSLSTVGFLFAKRFYFVKQLTGICWISCENFPLKSQHIMLGQYKKSKSQILGQDKQGLVILLLGRTSRASKLQAHMQEDAAQTFIYANFIL